MSVAHSIVSFLIALAILVVVHEFGHFWVARRAGVKILRFSVGFGRPLWRRRVGSDQTEFVVAAVPLGGYVKMLDERESPVPEAELDREFNRQPLAARAAIVLAGPLANFGLAIAAYWLMFVIGVSGLRPLIAEVVPGSAAARAGLTSGSEIVAVESLGTPTWDAVVHASLSKVLDGEPVVMRLRDASRMERDVTIDLGAIHPDDLGRGTLLQQLGLRPVRPHIPPLMGEVLAGGPAAEAGLKSGDRILTADGQAIDSWAQWVEHVQARPGQEIRIEVLRGGQELSLAVRPERVQEGGREIGRIGVNAQQVPQLTSDLVGIEQYGPIAALLRAADQTWGGSVMTLQIVVKMLFGDASVKNLSGPISIAKFAGESASIGLSAFLSFLASVSISLAVLNLLPIPLLDGGHLLYYFIELLTGRPVSVSVQRIGQQVGVVILAILMFLAFYNDITRLLG